MALQVGNIFASANAKTKGFTMGMHALGQSVLKFKKTALMGFGAVGAAVGAFIGKSVKTYASYSDELRTAANVTKQKGEAAQTLEEREKSLDETFKQLGKDTRFTMEEIAAAGAEIGRTGYNVDQTKDALRGVVDVASASGEELPLVAKKLTNVANGFGMEANELGRLGDIFAEASRSHNVTVQSLSEAMKYFAPIADSMGWSAEKATALMGVLGDMGIAAGQAGRQLKSVVTDWSKIKAGMELPTKDADVMKKVAESIGMSFGDLRKKIESGQIGLMEFLQMMGKSKNKVGELSQLFTKLASAPLAKLSESGELVANATEHLEKSTGSASEMARAKEDTLAGQMDILRGSFQKLQVDIGEKFGPAIQDFIENTLVKVVNKLGDWVEEMDSLDEVFQSLGKDVPGLEETYTALKTLFQWIINNKKATEAALEGIGGALATWKIASMVGGMTSPLGTVAAILGSIATISTMVASNWDEISGFFQEFANRISEVFGKLWTNLIENTGLGDLVKLIDTLIEKIKELVNAPEKVDEKIRETQEQAKGFLQGISVTMNMSADTKAMRNWIDAFEKGYITVDTKLQGEGIQKLIEKFSKKGGGFGTRPLVGSGDVKQLQSLFQDLGYDEEEKVQLLSTLWSSTVAKASEMDNGAQELKNSIDNLASVFSEQLLGQVIQNLDSSQSGTPWTGSGSKQDLAGFYHNREAVIPEHALKQGPEGVLGFLGMTPSMNAVPAQVSNAMQISIMPNLQEVNVDSSQRVAELSREMQRRFEQVLRGQGKK